MMVVKKDGRRSEFDRGKIIAGVRKACEKRPIPSGAVEALADEVEKAVLALNKAEVASTVIGEMVMERLRALDQSPTSALPPSTAPSPTSRSWSASWRR